MSHNQGSTDQIQFDGKIQFRPGPGPNKISKSRTSDQGQLKFLNVGPYQGRLEYLNSTGPCQQVFENLGLIFVDPFITLFLTIFFCFSTFYVSNLFLFCFRSTFNCHHLASFSWIYDGDKAKSCLGRVQIRSLPNITQTWSTY